MKALLHMIEWTAVERLNRLVAWIDRRLDLPAPTIIVAPTSREEE